MRKASRQHAFQAFRNEHAPHYETARARVGEQLAPIGFGEGKIEGAGWCVRLLVRGSFGRGGSGGNVSVFQQVRSAAARGRAFRSCSMSAGERP